MKDDDTYPLPRKIAPTFWGYFFDTGGNQLRCSRHQNVPIHIALD